MEKQIFNFDFVLFFNMIFLISFGIALQYSAGYSKEIYAGIYIQQFVRAIIGLVFLFLILAVDMKKINTYSVQIYFIIAFLLILTLIAGKEVNSTKAWLSIGPINLQISEFAKIATILLLAKYLEYNFKELDKLTDLVVPFIIILFQVFLILLEPDLGSVLVFFPVLFVMLYLAGANSKNLTALISIGLISIVLPLFISYYQFTCAENLPVWMKIITDKAILVPTSIFFILIILFLKGVSFLYKKYSFLNTISNVMFIIIISLIFSFTIQHALKPYQKKRLLVFINPKIDPYGSGYNIRQSKITIGSGGFWGKGFLKGPQTQLGFLPEQQTDFIVSIAGEEFGWIGMFLVLLSYFILVYKGLKITYNARTVYSSLVAGGITTMFIFQIFINIGMTIGVMPVTGIPLPFLSYGGSSLIASMIGVAILLKISSEKYSF